MLWNETPYHPPAHFPTLPPHSTCLPLPTARCATPTSCWPCWCTRAACMAATTLPTSGADWVCRKWDGRRAIASWQALPTLRGCDTTHVPPCLPVSTRPGPMASNGSSLTMSVWRRRMIRRPLRTTGAARERRRREVRHLQCFRWRVISGCGLPSRNVLYAHGSPVLVWQHRNHPPHPCCPPCCAGFGNPLRFTRHANAYMLVYVRESEWDTVMCQVGTRTETRLC